VLSPELEKIRREVARVTGDFSEEHWLCAPEGKWNSACILEHLMLSYTGTTKGLQRAMAGGSPMGGKPTVKDRFRCFVVLGLGLLPRGRTAPKHTTPKDGLPPGSVQKFSDALVAMDATLMDAEKRFGCKAKVLDHPIIGPLNAKQWRRFHCAHAMHHLKQIKQRSQLASRNANGGISNSAASRAS
jgi:hypothetical protein